MESGYNFEENPYLSVQQLAYSAEKVPNSLHRQSGQAVAFPIPLQGQIGLVLKADCQKKEASVVRTLLAKQRCSRQECFVRWPWLPALP
jgi:hypothetical protein